MGYRYTDPARADRAFEAEGRNLEDVFRSSADAVANVMVDDPSRIRPKVVRELHMVSRPGTELGELGSLLFEFLQSLVDYKDAEQLLLRVNELSIRPSPEEELIELQAKLVGEPIGLAREDAGWGVDVKGVALHRFSLRQEDGRWKACVALDI